MVFFKIFINRVVVLKGRLSFSSWMLFCCCKRTKQSHLPQRPHFLFLKRNDNLFSRFCTHMKCYQSLIIVSFKSKECFPFLVQSIIHSSMWNWRTQSHSKTCLRGIPPQSKRVLFSCFFFIKIVKSAKWKLGYLVLLHFKDWLLPHCHSMLCFTAVRFFPRVLILGKGIPYFSPRP